MEISWLLAVEEELIASFTNLGTESPTFCLSHFEEECKVPQVALETMIVCLFHKTLKGIYSCELWSFLTEPFSSVLGCARNDSVAALGNYRDQQVAKPPTGVGALWVSVEGHREETITTNPINSPSHPPRNQPNKRQKRELM